VLRAPIFVAAAVASLLASWLLVSRLERIGERLGLSEALLGILAALAADAPEITAAITALASHQQRIGAGVVLGSNVFNLAALLGLGALVAGRIGLHRRVVVLSGTVAMLVAVMCVLVVAGVVPALAGLLLGLAVLACYVLVLAGRGHRPGLPPRWRAWLRSAVAEEELELEDAIRPRPGRWLDAVGAAAALTAVVAASIAMERAASSLGTSLGVPEIITGGLVLAAVTSLPNAVAAVYLAARGRGAAALSTALSSNTLNVLAGLLLPGAVLGLGAPAGQAQLITAWYAGLTLAVLALAWRHRGLTRSTGLAIVAAYAGFVGSVLASSYAGPDGTALVGGLTGLSAAALAAALLAGLRGQRAGRQPRRAVLWPALTARRLWAVSMIAASVVAAVDAATGPRVILIGLLVVAPCLAILTGWWLPTVITGGWACCLAVVLGLPDGIWGTGGHLAFIGATAVVSAAATAGSAVIGRAVAGPG
jgi:cation:H+ antiporter